MGDSSDQSVSERLLNFTAPYQDSQDIFDDVFKFSNLPMPMDDFVYTDYATDSKFILYVAGV